MSTDEYRYFVAVYNCRSFSDAARKMCISSQGIGKSVKSLEAQLGVKLFERTSQGVKPTPIATEIYQSYCNILAEEDRISELVAAARKPSNVQTLIGRDSRMGDAIATAVNEYCKNRDFKIEMLLTREPEEKQAETFVEKGYDYRFLSVELDKLPNYPRAPICTLHYVAVVNADSDLAKKGFVSFDDLRDRTVLTTNYENTPMHLLAALCRERGFELKLRAIEKTYIWDVLLNSVEDITFIRMGETKEYPWMSNRYAKLLMDPPFNTQIVLQTSHDKLDDELVQCIRKILIERDFDESERKL